MIEGFVYVLTSVNCPHIKIGGTTNPPAVRIREINGTSSYRDVGPWQLSDFRQVRDWRLVEADLHQRFASNRVLDVEGTRELFSVAVSEARQALTALPRELLVRVDEVDRMFQDRDLALYLERLFSFTGLASWLHIQGAWTLRLYPSTSGGRFFTLNIGDHEVAYSPLARVGYQPRHVLIVDKLVEDFSDVRAWLDEHDGYIREATYKKGYGRAATVDFAAGFAEAEQLFAVPGIRRALVAYWSEALVDLWERNAKSAYSRVHDYNATAAIVTRLANRQIFNRQSSSMTPVLGGSV